MDIVDREDLGARGLSQGQLDDACGDARTRVPDRLQVRACSGVRVFVRRIPPSPRYVVMAE